MWLAEAAMMNALCFETIMASAPYFGRPINQHRPVQLLDPPMQDQMYSDHQAYDHRLSTSDAVHDKFVDEPTMEESALFSDAPVMNRSSGMYQGVPRKGIWRVDELREFQNQSLAMQILRVLFFILVIGIILALCIIMLIFVFLRPPNIGVKDVSAPLQSDVRIQGTSVQVPANISFVISNPNYVPATIKNITANAYDKKNQDTSMGVCHVLDQEIKSRANTTVTLPCKLEYNLEKDPHLAIIKDIARSCFQSKDKHLQILLKVNLKVKLYSFTVPIDVNPTISFECPVTKKQVQQIVGHKVDLDDILRNVGRRSLPETWSAFSQRFLPRDNSSPADEL